MKSKAPRPPARRRRSARGRPPAREIAARAENLLDVATQVFLDQGFQGASMGEIARRAGASKQTLYARYPSKAALFAGLIERKSAQIFDEIGVLAPDAPLRDTLLRFGTNFLGMILSSDARGLHRVVIAECIDFPELSELFWKLGAGRTRAMLGAYFRAQQQRGSLRAANPEHTVEAFLGLLISTASLRGNLNLPSPLQHSAAQRKAWVEFAVDLFLAAMRPASLRVSPAPYPGVVGTLRPRDIG